MDFTNTKLSWRRSPFDYAKVQTLVGRIVRNKRFFADIKQPGCCLDLGCGPNISAKFCNLDYCWKPGVDVCWDVTRGLPFPDGHVGGIFTEHMLEHLTLDQGLELLRECRRVLRPRSILRVVVPDGGLYLAEYSKHVGGRPSSIPFECDDARKFPVVTPMVSINRIFRHHGHLFIWDFETLHAALRLVGFTEITRCKFGEGADINLLRDTPARQIESLYVEASGSE